MAIFKTRKHNDEPSLVVVEMYDDQGRFISDRVADDTSISIVTVIDQLMYLNPENMKTDYGVPEQLLTP